MRRRTVAFLSVLTFVLVLSPLSLSMPANNHTFSLPNQIVQAYNYTNITVQQAKLMIDSNPLFVVLDVRNQSEYNSGHIRNSRLIPLSELPSRLGELDNNRTTLVYCQTGGQSTSGSQVLVANGFEHVYNMLGGITAWKDAGYPIYIRYSSLQKAINNATTGDTIRVSIGTYMGTITIDKQITLEGENKTTTIISNNYTSYHAISIAANNACIQDFTIKNGYYAVFCLQTSTNLTIQDNIIRDNNPPLATGWGITLYGTRHIIRNNIITNNGFGVILGGYGNNIITENTIVNSSASGIELRNSKNNEISENLLANNYLGIRFYTESNNNTIAKNAIANCTIGISVHDSSWNCITRNSIKNNTSLGISLLQSNNNIIYHNNIINNTKQLENLNLTNNWDNGFLEGNFWSDYNGTDLDGDGIGDAMLPWQKVDNYPLINPYLDGDYNHDGIVDWLDADLLGTAWQSRHNGANYNPHADFNMDGIIDIKDVAILGVNWLKGNPQVVVGVWWDTIDGSDYTDTELLEDARHIKSMNFTAIYCVEKSIMDGSKDDDLNNTWTARMVKLAEQENLKIVWVIWETDNPAQWVNKNLNNATFRNWFAQHLTALSTFIKQHPCIIEICFDDFGPESQYLNMTEFTLFVRQHIGYPTLIEYDDKYDSLNPQFLPKTVTSGYLYYYQDPSAWGTFWIDYIKQHYDGNYPSHTLRLVFEAFERGGGNWSPDKHRPQIEAAINHHFSHYEYFAWRWHTPDEWPAIHNHPEYWEGIKQNNEYIVTTMRKAGE